MFSHVGAADVVINVSMMYKKMIKKKCKSFEFLAVVSDGEYKLLHNFYHNLWDNYYAK